MNSFLIVYNNIYLRNIINNHLKKHYYNNSIKFKDIQSFLNYTDKEYLWNVDIVHYGNEDLKLYLKVISAYENITNIKIYQESEELIENQIIPNNIISIVFENHQNLNLNSFQFSSNLKKIKFNFDSKYNSEIQDGVLPKSLEELSFGAYYNQKCPLFSSNLTTLKFNSYFNQPIVPNILPNSLKKLELGDFYQENDFNQIIELNVLPYGLTSLSIGNYFQHIGKGVLPNTIKTLKIGYLSQDISDIIPLDCKTLYINSHQIISSIPSSITELRYAYTSRDQCSNIFINSQFIPNTIKILELSSLNILVGDQRLPDSITEIELEYCNQHTLDNYLPISDNFKKLMIINEKALEFKDNLHYSIVDLDLCQLVGHYETLPHSLTRLEFSSTFSILENIDLSSRLKSLVDLTIYSSFENCSNFGKELFPDTLKALSLNYGRHLNSYILPSSIQIFQLYHFSNFEINNKLLQLLSSLNHLILLDCKDFKIINPENSTNLSIYLDYNSFSSLKSSNENFKTVDYLNDIFFNLKLITLNGNSNLYKNLINKVVNL